MKYSRFPEGPTITTRTKLWHFCHRAERAATVHGVVLVTVISHFAIFNANSSWLRNWVSLLNIVMVILRNVCITGFIIVRFVFVSVTLITEVLRLCTGWVFVFMLHLLTVAESQCSADFNRSNQDRMITNGIHLHCRDLGTESAISYMATWYSNYFPDD